MSRGISRNEEGFGFWVVRGNRYCCAHHILLTGSAAENIQTATDNAVHNTAMRTRSAAASRRAAFPTDRNAAILKDRAMTALLGR